MEQRTRKRRTVSVNSLIELVKARPTAYDVNKVVAQLDKKIARLDSRQQICYESGDFKASDRMADKMVAFIECKKIVKGGGIDGLD